ncbi:hypothetical protein R3I94_019426 [Phoxinus phoxinus]
MDLGWKRVPMLLILLIFWKHAFGQKGWSSHDVPPHQKWHDHKIASPRGAQSSVLEAPVTGSIPFEEVASNVLAGKSLNAKRSRFSLSSQYVKGGISSSDASMSHTQSAPSSSVSASLVFPQNQQSLYSNTPLQLQGSFSPSVQDITSQPIQLGETSSPLSAPSSSSTGSSASSLSKFTYSSQGSSRPQLAGSSSQLVSTDGVYGLLPQSQSTAGQNIPGSSVYAKLAASPPSVSQSTSDQSSYSQYTSGSQRRVGTKLAASRQYVPTLESIYDSSFQPQGTTSQYAPTFSLGTKVPVPSQYYPATLSGSSQKWQPSSTTVLQGFQTSGASQSISQYPSRFVSLSSASADRSSLQLQGTASQYAPASLDVKVPVYSQTAPSGFSLSMSQPSQLKPSTSMWSQGFQASGTETSQSNTPSQSSKSRSRFSTLTSSSPGKLVSTQDGSGRYSGLFSQSQSVSSQYAPAALDVKVPVYSQAAPSGFSSSTSQQSQWQPSTSRWSQGFQTSGTETSQSSSPSQGSKSTSRFSTLTSAASPGQSFSNVYTSNSLSRAGAQLAGSSRYVPKQTGSMSTDGLSLQLQDTSSQYAPAALDVKVPVYSQAAPSRFSSSTSQQSQWQPSTSRWSQGFQASGTVASQGFQTSGTATSQSIFPSQGSKSTSRFSTLTSAASSGKSVSNVYTSSSLSNAGAQLAGSSRYVPMQTASTSSDGSSLQLQGTSSEYAPAFLVTKVHPYKPAAPSGSSSLSQPSQWQPSTSRWSQGFQASGTVASQSSSPSQGSKSTSRFSTLPSAASPGKLFITQDGSGRYSGLSSQSQSASSQYAPAALDAKVPVYSQAAQSGFSSSTSQQSQWQPSTSRWSQGFQASGTVASQSSSPSQGSKSTSRFSTLTSAASPGQSFSNVYTSNSLSRAGAQLAGSSRYVPKQTGSMSTDGLSLQLQDTSSQYAPAALDAKVPVYSQAAPSGFSSSTSQQSQWQPSTSKWSQGFQASGTVASQGFQTSGTATSQSIFPSQGSKSTSRFSTLPSAASPGKLFITQDGSGRYSGLSSQSQSASSQYAPAALDAKVPVYSQAAQSGFSSSTSQQSQWQPSTSRWSQGFQASGTVASQSSSPSQGSKSTSRFSTLTSAASPGKLFFTQDGSGRYSGLSSQSQSASSQYTPGSPGYAKHGSSLLDSSRQSTSDLSSSPQLSSGSSFMAALSLPVDSLAQSSSSNSWRTSSLSGVGPGPSMLSSKAASGSIRRQMSPGLFGSVQHPTDSSTYGQKPSQSFSTSGRYFSSVKG